MPAFVKPIIGGSVSRPNIGIFEIWKLGEFDFRVDFAENFADGKTAEREFDRDDEIFLKLVVEAAGGIGAAGDGLDGVRDVAEVVGEGQGLLFSLLGLGLRFARRVLAGPLEPRENERRADSLVVAKVMRGLAQDEAIADRRIFGD